MSKILEIKSSDNTDTLIMTDKIQYVLEKKNGCLIGLDGGFCINSSAKFKDVAKAIEK